MTLNFAEMTLNLAEPCWMIIRQWRKMLPHHKSVSVLTQLSLATTGQTGSETVKLTLNNWHRQLLNRLDILSIQSIAIASHQIHQLAHAHTINM